jgi:DNA-binding NarL/FixJ family response regulator
LTAVAAVNRHLDRTPASRWRFSRRDGYVGEPMLEDTEPERPLDVEGIRTVARGETLLAPEAVRRLVDDETQASRHHSALPGRLTELTEPSRTPDAP